MLLQTKSPAFQLYPKDALSDTLHPSPEEFTAYWRLVFQAWLGVNGAEQGHLPARADDSKLRTMTALTPAQWRKAKEGALSLFRQGDDGYYHKRLVIERDKQIDLREKRSVAGRHGVEVKQARSNGQASGEQNTSSPTPVSNLHSAEMKKEPPVAPQGGRARKRGMTRRQKEALGPFADRQSGDGKDYLRDGVGLLSRKLDGDTLGREESERLGALLAVFQQSATKDALAWFQQKLEGEAT